MARSDPRELDPHIMTLIDLLRAGAPEHLGIGDDISEKVFGEDTEDEFFSFENEDFEDAPTRRKPRR